MHELPSTLGALRASRFSEDRIATRTVKDEIRQNLICKLQKKEPLFPGIVGFEETVVPHIVNALLSRHNFILLGLRGQAKTRIIRMLATLLDEKLPYVAGCEIRDNPYRPLCRQCQNLIEEKGDDTPIAWLTRSHRYVEKLATPDVTIADMIGDIDPIKAARRGRDISDELTVHYGLLPRANRGIFAINELPDLAGKIQVGLFNIMQEGDVQIKGYPVRLPLDLMLVFTANPEDYTARGKIITPLKDRIGSEIRTHYPVTLDQGMAITEQEAWGVSQRLPISVLENVVSNAERRALKSKERVAVPRVLDIYSALPSITGKMELEYEGELKGGDTVARELIRVAVGKVYDKYFEGANVSQIVQWFDLGGSLKLDEGQDSAAMVRALASIQGLMEKLKGLKLSANEPDAVRASAAEFVLEGLYAHRRISRNEEREFGAGERKREGPREEGPPQRPNVRRQYN